LTPAGCEFALHPVTVMMPATATTTIAIHGRDSQRIEAGSDRVDGGPAAVDRARAWDFATRRSR